MDTKLTSQMEQALRDLAARTRDQRDLPGGKGVGRLNGWVGASGYWEKTYRALERRGMAVMRDGGSRGRAHVTAAGLEYLGAQAGSQADPEIVPPASFSADALKELCEAGNAAACAELDRRGLEPPVIEPAPPIAGDEMADDEARELLRLLGRYFDAYPDEAPAMTVSELVEDLATADPGAPLTERLSAARVAPGLALWRAMKVLNVTTHEATQVGSEFSAGTVEDATEIAGRRVGLMQAFRVEAANAEAMAVVRASRAVQA